MAPPKRVPCRRLRSRLTVLSDGRIVSCEEDVAGLQALGRVGEMSIAAAWQAMEQVRLAHARLSLEQLPLCRKCREWHRP
jgi:radical SAM protein with 4Fe4S-binding SPASM domain